MSLLCVCHDAPRNGTVISDQFNIPSGPGLGVHLTLAALDRIGLLETLSYLGVKARPGRSAPLRARPSGHERPGPPTRLRQGSSCSCTEPSCWTCSTRWPGPTSCDWAPGASGWTKMPWRSPRGSTTGARRGATCWSEPTASDRSSARPCSVRTPPLRGLYRLACRDPIRPRPGDSRRDLGPGPAVRPVGHDRRPRLLVRD